jgi:ribosomal protein S27AE
MTVNRQTRGRHRIPPQSPHFITLRRGQAVTEETRHKDASQRQETTRSRRSSNGCANTRNLRRYSDTCGFLLSDYNDLGLDSASYRVPFICRPVSGFENKPTQPCRQMHHHNQNTRNHTTEDVSTTDHRTTPAECPACDSSNTTTEGDIWYCGHCGASGLVRGDRA